MPCINICQSPGGSGSSGGTFFTCRPHCGPKVFLQAPSYSVSSTSKCDSRDPILLLCSIHSFPPDISCCVASSSPLYPMDAPLSLSSRGLSSLAGFSAGASSSRTSVWVPHSNASGPLTVGSPGTYSSQRESLRFTCHLEYPRTGEKMRWPSQNGTCAAIVLLTPAFSCISMPHPCISL